jgi:small conductance mechanosensitive channel
MFYCKAFFQKPFTSRLIIIIILSLAAGFAVNASGNCAIASAQENHEVPKNKDTADTPGPGGHLIELISERMEKGAGHLAEAGKGLLAVPAVIGDLIVRAQDPDNLLRWAEIMLKVIAVLAAGLLAAWVIKHILGRPRLLIKDRETDRIWGRVLFLLSRTVLDIIPIAGAAIAAYAVLPATNPAPETRIIALSLVSAAVAVALILAIAKMLFTPDAESLRLFFKEQQTGHYLYIWIRRFAVISIFGHFILEASALMGMAHALHGFLTKLLGFVIMLLLITLILQNKKEVASWLHEKGKKPQKSNKNKAIFPVAATFLRRLADGWHFVAIIAVAGFYATWALEIAGGRMFLLSGLAKTLVVMVFAAILLRLAEQGTKAIFHINDDVKKTYPGIEERANRYLPLVRGSFSAIIYVVALFAVLEAWGLGTLGWLFSPMGWALVSELAIIFLILGASVLVWEIVCMKIERSLAREASRENGSTRKLTLLPLLKNVVRISLALIALMLVLSRLNINIGPLLAGAGVIGLAVGFGAQALVRDMISGAFILIEDSISVGDWVEAAGRSGTVEKMTIRTLTLRDLAGTVYVIPFGEVTTVINYNRDYGYALIDAGVAYRESYNEVVAALQDVAAQLRNDEIWSPYIIGDLEIFGMNNLGDSAVEIRVRLKTTPMKQFAVRRAFLERMKHVFDQRDIEIPFPQRTVWFGTGKDGSAPPMKLATEARKQVESLRPNGDNEQPPVKIASELEASRDVMEEVESSGQKPTSD